MNYTDESTSRFFRIDDPYIESLCFKRRFPHRSYKWDFIKAGWWSRIYEYKWLTDAATTHSIRQKLNTALDAASGIEHPGCFMLADLHYSMVTAQDIEPTHPLIKKSTRKNIQYLCKNITATPEINYSFVCCISALEHMPIDTQRLAMQNLCDAVEPGGVLAITLDVPGFEYQTDLDLCRDVITERGLIFKEENVPEDERLSSRNGRIKHSGWPELGIDVGYVYRFFARKPG